MIEHFSIEPYEHGHRLTQVQLIEQPLSEVWEFFSNAENLQRLTPAFLKFKILTPCPIEMRVGALIDYRISLFGVPMTWKTEITEYTPKKHFVDNQIKGPYARWHHTHRFEEVPGGTRMTDEVEYRVPMGALGSMAHGLFVRRTLGQIFAFRGQAVAEVFGAA